MCFSIGWIEQLCVWIVIVIALISILRIVVPWLAGIVSLPGPVIAIINIVIWAVIAIAAIYIIFGLLSCLFTGGFSLLPHYH
jgi:membrane protein DedA with SNARE-associated domain